MVLDVIVVVGLEVMFITMWLFDLIIICSCLFMCMIGSVVGIKVYLLCVLGVGWGMSVGVGMNRW